MRLLTIGSLPPEWGGQARGGVATFHATLLEGLLARRDAVEIVGAMPPAPPELEPPVPTFARPDGIGVADFYAQLLERLEPDVVLMNHVAHTVGATHARLAPRPPAVGVAHSWHNITYRSGEEQRRARALTDEALAGLAALVVGSRHCLAEGRELGLRYPAAATAIHYPVQPLYLAGDIDPTATERHGVTFLASLIPRKDPIALVEAAALMPGVAVTLAGEGELEQPLRALISRRSLQDRVRLVGHATGGGHLRAVRDLLLRSEAMCLPSHSESFGLVFIEALACGTPVVGFGPTVREIRDTLGIDIGEPLDGGGPEEIAAAIERVRARRWDRRELRRRTLEAFGPDRVTERYLGLLGRVAGEPAAPPPAPPPSSRPPAPQAPQAPQASPATPATRRPPSPTASTAVCVLGMSRSGTSLTARMLGLAGVHLGPEEELLHTDLHQLADPGARARASEANPDGFFEHYRMMRLNERLLRAHGGSWREPPRLAPGWEAADALAAERDEAQALVDASFAGHATWGWKDPRNSLTLPFWQQLLPDIRCVICLRNPVDVAASLAHRDGMAAADAFALWRAYVASALVNTAGRPRLLVSYDEYFSDWRGTAERLSRFAGMDPPAAGTEAEHGLREAIDAQLRHHRTRIGAAAAEPSLPPDVAGLYLVAELLRVAAPDSEGGEPEAAELHAGADAYARRLLG